LENDAAIITPEAIANVTYLGVVPYQEIKRHIIETTVCVFPTFAELCLFPGSKQWLWKKHCKLHGWAEVIDDGQWIFGSSNAA
jgi:hypothetical protein